MIVPSIDIMDGCAVQLRQGRELVLDGGDPFQLLERFAVTGETAVIDLDAARGTGTNAEIIRQMVARAPCRVGGGIRSLDAARAWLDAGATRIILGTAATPDLCGALPRERVMAALDARDGEVVVQGWEAGTGETVLDRAGALAPYVGGFLYTQVEREGMLAGIDLSGIVALHDAVGASCHITAAGGITTADDLATLANRGIDAQVGMALYTGRLGLGEAFAACVKTDAAGLIPTVVCDEHYHTLGLVWSNRESVTRAIDERRGIYWSRSRQQLWVKGETSGATQELVRADVDCDRDTLRFTVRQRNGFCHTGSRSCWGDGFTLSRLEQIIAQRREAGDPASGTAKLFARPSLLSAKLREEADELAVARGPEAAAHEAADVFYFALAALTREGATLADVIEVLARRNLRVTRRPMSADGTET